MRLRLRCRLEDHTVVEILRLFAGRHAGFGCRPFLATTRNLLERVEGDNGHVYDKYYNNGWIWQDPGTPPGAEGSG